MTFKVEKVENQKQFNEFLQFQQHLYRFELQSELFVSPPPLLMRILLSNWRSSNRALYLLKKNNRVVARLAGERTKKRPEVMHFGFFEAMPDLGSAVSRLFQAFIEDRATHQLIGPYHFSMEDPYTGLLVEGFDQAPTFLMPYNPPYYATYLKQAGLNPVQEILSYQVSSKHRLPPKLIVTAQELLQQGFQLRFMERSLKLSDFKNITDIFNDALSNNWGFEPFDRLQTQKNALFFLSLVNPKAVAFVEKEGRPIGCCIMLPNYNLALRKGWDRGKIFKQWWQARNYPEQMRGFALGVRKEFHGKGVGSLLVAGLWRRCTEELGVQNCQISWVLKDNERMNRLIEQMGGRPTQRYQIFAKNLKQ